MYAEVFGICVYFVFDNFREIQINTSLIGTLSASIETKDKIDPNIVILDKFLN